MTILPDQIAKAEQEILAKLTPILRSFSVEEPITQATVFEQVKMDSLDVVELCMACEDEFDVVIDDDVIATVKTVGDLVRLLARKKS